MDTLIFDMGSQRLKCGTASAALAPMTSSCLGDRTSQSASADAPLWPYTIPTLAGHPRFRARFPNVDSGSRSGEQTGMGPPADVLYAGYDAWPLTAINTPTMDRQSLCGRGLLKLSYPVRHGVIVDDAAAVLLLRQGATASLLCDRSNDGGTDYYYCRRDQHTPKHAKEGSPNEVKQHNSSIAVGVRAAAAQREAELREAQMRDREAMAADTPGGVFSHLRAQVSATMDLVSEHGVHAALVEHPFASRSQRAWMAELLFETNSDSEGAKRAASSSLSPLPAPRQTNNPFVKSLFCGVAPLLALYASGRTTGVAIEVGDAVVSTACAVNGHALTPAMQRSDGTAGGDAVTDFLRVLLRVHSTIGSSGGDDENENRKMNRGGRVHNARMSVTEALGTGSTAEKELIRDIKERCCRVLPHRAMMNGSNGNTESSTEAGTTTATTTVRGSSNGVAAMAQRRRQDALRELDARVARTVDSYRPSHTHVSASTDSSATKAATSRTLPAEDATYRLPDGSLLRLGATPTFVAAEAHFSPFLTGRGEDIASVTDLLLATVYHASIADDLSTRSLLLSNVVLSGGATLLPGFGARLCDELHSGAAGSKSVAVVASRDRAHAPWLGAAFLSQLSTFPSMCVSREVYLEEGESALYARLFQ